jgi:hypothetical protein
MQAKFLANFKVEKNHKVVRQRANDLASLQPAIATPKVSETNEIQSLRAYIDEQREQMEQIIGGMQNDYKRLACAFDKSIVANFPSHKVETGENTCNSSVADWHDQSQPIYGMPIDTYPRQPQPPAHIGGKPVDLRTTRPSGPAATIPFFPN